MKIQIATLLVAGTLASMAGAQSPSFSTADIPVGIRMHSSSDHIRKGFQSGIIRCDALHSKVSITWTSSAIENQMPDPTLVWDHDNKAMGNNIVQTSVQEFGVDYYPTAACVVSPEELLIGGVYKDGTTVIEKWTLTWPKIGQAVAISTQTGLTSVGISSPKKSLTKTLYKGDVAGKKLVRNLIGLRKSSGLITSYLVQFAGSGDVYSGDFAGSPFTLVGSSTNSAGSLGLVQGLGGDSQTGLMFGNRTTVGNVYTFFMMTPTGGTMSEIDAPYALHVILIDTNRDGVIDTYLQPTPFEWLSQGWTDLGSYTNWWLD